MSNQLSPPVGGAHDIEQVLLGLADGSYVLSTPDGAVAECGTGVVALLGASAESLAGRRTADALVAGADAEAREAFDRVLHARGGGSPIFRTTTAGGTRRSLQFVVVSVPLALGWEFTSLLGELGSRDAGTWHPEALRLRHGRALEAIEGVCRDGSQPDPGARLAGILIVVRDVDAPALTREDVGRRMAEQRTAARAAAAEAARHADAATGRVPAGDDAPAGEAAGLDDLVERARILRERVEEAEREAATARADRDQALTQLAAARQELEVARGEELAGAAAERDALREELDRTRAQLHETSGELQGARAEIESLTGELRDAHEQLDATRAAAEVSHAEREQARIRASELLGEAEAARAAAEAIRAEFAFDEPRAGAAGADGAAGGTAAGAAPSDPSLQLPPAAPGEALALIGQDGTFKRLDDAFCSLLGCREEDLRAARWPSVIDRENLAAHQEVARALRAGEIHSAPVETVYMHAQGLLVPVAGTVTLHRPAGGGAATHFLFRADVRRTSGT